MRIGQNLRVDYPDDDLKDRVESFLFSRHFPGFRELSVQVQNGTVTVSGEVNSYYEKQIAINSCRRVAGVLGVADEIQVHEPLQSRADSSPRKPR